MAEKHIQSTLNTPRTIRFFIEKRYVDFCLWVHKIHNRKGYIAEIYRVDERGRRCCILVPEGMDKSDWAYFFDMLTCKKNLERREPALRLSSCRDKSTKKYSLSSDSDSLRRSYAEVVSSSTSSESEYFYATNRTSLKNFTPTVRSEVKKEGKKDDFDKNKVVILSRRCFHDDWEKIIDRLKEQTD